MRASTHGTRQNERNCSKNLLTIRGGDQWFPRPLFPAFWNLLRVEIELLSVVVWRFFGEQPEGCHKAETAVYLSSVPSLPFD